MDSIYRESISDRVKELANQIITDELGCKDIRVESAMPKPTDRTGFRHGDDLNEWEFVLRGPKGKSDPFTTQIPIKYTQGFPGWNRELGPLLKICLAEQTRLYKA